MHVSVSNLSNNDAIIEDTDFKDYITKKYSIVNSNINLSKMDQH